ncbi:MAG: PP2C family protein-serine/threonine phosphatase [bacterium]
MMSRSHQGLVRINNEDCVHCEPEHEFVVLADGMGGLLAGEVASSVAVESASRALRDPRQPRQSADDLKAVLNRANEAVLARARSMRYLGKMGTTLVVWAMQGEQAFFSHVGDSRLYVYRAGKLFQVTHDHTLAQRMIDSGEIAPEDADNAPNKHVLTHAMGLPGAFKADAGEVPEFDRVLLCSDGLSDLVAATDIEAIMATPDLEDCCNFLLKAALDKGGRDNVTVAVIER